MNENPFLASIERRGELRAAHRLIIKALEQKFGEVPEDVRAGVIINSDTESLDKMFDYALRCESLQAFAQLVE